MTLADRRDWLNGKPFEVAVEHLVVHWGGYTDGRTFRCHLCGVFFALGSMVRFVMCNGVREAQDAGAHCGNVFVCASCDSPNIYAKLAEHGRNARVRYWSLLEPSRLPPNPNFKPRVRR